MSLSPLFGYDQLGYDWVTASVADAIGQLDAIEKLVAARDRLPAPLFVRIPSGKVGHAQWSPIVAATSPLCACGERRMLVPTQSRSELISDMPPRIVVVTEGSPLAIAPWGGDVESAYMQFTLREGALIVRSSPFGPPLRYMHEGAGILTAVGLRPNDRELSVDDLEMHLAAYGPRVGMQQIDDIMVPLCEMTRIGPGGDDRIGVTFELDASVITVQPTDRPRFHRCTLAA